MVQWFKRLQELPTFENEETARIAALLRMGLPLGFSLNLAFFLAIIVFVPHQTVFQLALLGGLALEITGFWLLKRGYARISAWLVIIFASAMTTAVLFVLGPNYESNFITHLVIVLFAGLILGARSVPLIGGISLVSWAIGLIGYNAGWLQGQNYPMDFEYRLISDVAIFVFSCVFIFWTAYKTEQALIQSRNTTQALQQALDDLQHTTISRTFLDNILQSMAEMLVVLDMEGQIVMVNESLLNCLGYAQAELIGQPFQRISVAGISDTSSVETLLTASPVRYSESTYRAQDGSEVAVLFSSHPLAGENGQVQGVVCVAQDITEQLRNRQAMLNSEKRFLAVAEASQTAVIMMSKTNILYT
ncbi:MAG: PAS domain-containing protein, partial [Anaerolineae bacterium]|nr:PAS domain-containing protein [Anaerolineae bacterium]